MVQVNRANQKNNNPNIARAQSSLQNNPKQAGNLALYNSLKRKHGELTRREKATLAYNDPNSQLAKKFTPQEYDALVKRQEYYDTFRNKKGEFSSDSDAAKVIETLATKGIVPNWNKDLSEKVENYFDKVKNGSMEGIGKAHDTLMGELKPLMDKDNPTKGIDSMLFKAVEKRYREDFVNTNDSMISLDSKGLIEEYLDALNDGGFFKSHLSDEEKIGLNDNPNTNINKDGFMENNPNSDGTKKDNFDISKLLQFYMDPKTGGMNTKSIEPFKKWKAENLYLKKLENNRSFHAMRVKVLENLMLSTGRNVNLSSSIF